MSKHILSLIVLGASFALTACQSDSGVAPLSVNGDNAAARGSGGTTSARIRVEALLAATQGSAFPQAHGDATWTSRNDNAKRELEIEIEDVKAGTVVTFFLGGAQVGVPQITNSLRAARISLSTELGDQVPANVSGMQVEVRAGDAVIASGSFK